MNTYPISFDVPYQERHSRLKALFRLILVIPSYLFVLAYGLAALLAVLVSWFILLVTAKYPARSYNFVAGYVRADARMYAYLFLLTDRYPPFSGASDPPGDFPVNVVVGAQKNKYSRLKVLFRLILFIPVLILSAIRSWLAQLLWVVAWLSEVITGKLPQGVYNLLLFVRRYQTRVTGYQFLLTENYPPDIADEDLTPAGATQ